MDKTKVYEAFIVGSIPSIRFCNLTESTPLKFV